jgi:hypothetical protein
MRPKSLLTVGFPTALWMIATLGTPPECRAQDTVAFHSFTADAGAGAAPIFGQDRKSLSTGPYFQFGAGFAIPFRREAKYGPTGPLPQSAWRFYLKGNFMWDRSGVDSSALEQAIINNPQNTALLSATSAKAKFYALTFDPTVRFAAGDHWSLYLLGGFGWLRRSIGFSGVSSQGNLIEPSSSPSVFAAGGNSGVVDAGVGTDWSLSSSGRGARFYIEARVLHGLSNNIATTLLPLAAGIRW